MTALTFGECMYIARRRADVTQTALAERVGCQLCAISQIERDKWPWNADHHRARIVEALGQPEVWALCERTEAVA